MKNQSKLVARANLSAKVPTSLSRFLLSPYFSILLTMALPTITASAKEAAFWADEAEEIPNPIPIGFEVSMRIL